MGWADIPELSTCVGCCSAAWLQCWLQSRRNGADPRSSVQAGHIPSWRGSCECHALSPVAADGGWWLLLLQLLPGICLVTARAVQRMAPYPGQARCLALGFWPECFRRLNVKGGQRPFPKETRSALDIEGKHVTIQGPSPDLTSSVSGLLRDSAHVRQVRSRCLRCCTRVAVIPLSRPSHRARGHEPLHLELAVVLAGRLLFQFTRCVGDSSCLLPLGVVAVLGCHIVSPALCRGWSASGPGRLGPSPWYLTGVSACLQDQAGLRVYVRQAPSPVVVVRRSRSRLGLEGRARKLRGPFPDLSTAGLDAFFICCA